MNIYVCIDECVMIPLLQVTACLTCLSGLPMSEAILPPNLMDMVLLQVLRHLRRLEGFII